jgi:hypothetical protein
VIDSTTELQAAPHEARWEVGLSGDEPDLWFLATYFSTGSPRVVRAHRNEGYALCDDSFDQLETDESIRERAAELLHVLVGALRLDEQQTGSIAVGAVVRVLEDGQHAAHVFAHDTVRFRDEASAEVVRQGSVAPEPIQPVQKRAVGLASSDAAVAKVLRLLGKGDDNWVNLYRVFEVVEEDLGGQHQAQQAGLVADADIRRFKHSSNSVAVGGDDARHGKGREAAPASPMSLSEATKFVKRFARAWLERKSGPR